MKIRFFLLLVLFGINNCLACKCVEYSIKEKVNIGFKKADIIFYGELIKYDTLKMTYSFKIYEIFKGKVASKIINGNAEGSSCDLFPNEKGLWIVYGNFNSDKTLIGLSACSPTQSQNFGPGFPPIPFKFDSKGKIISKNEIEMSLFNLENQNKSLQSFIYQLEKLRQYKQNQNTISENSQSSFYQKIVIVSVIVNAILFLSLIMVINRKRV
ncbi:hypothetical protein [Flavobacterium sp.]|uniref:hypothetical protein n=1 Tax=Flavobacterium sp. TaxID=239 RepID=UPI002638033F|nr:hypothetical protein [Flavobacterium sp.]